MGKRGADGGVTALLVPGVAFLLGGIVGCLLAQAVGGGAELGTYLQRFVAAAHVGVLPRPGILSLLWGQVRWPLLVVLLGRTGLGRPGLPLLFAARGFLLAFSVGSFVRAFGAAGGVLALSVFGPAALFSIPIFFVWGVHGWSRLRGDSSPGGEGVRLLLSGLALIAGVCAEHFLAPLLFKAAAGLLSV